MSGRLEIVSLKPHFSKKTTIQNQNEGSSHKRYNSVNNRTVLKYEKEYNNHLNSDIYMEDNIFPGTSNRKNHSQIARMELNQTENNPFSLKNPEFSRRSVRKRVKRPQISGKKKLPNCFSITSKEI